MYSAEYVSNGVYTCEYIRWCASDGIYTGELDRMHQMECTLVVRAFDRVHQMEYTQVRALNDVYTNMCIRQCVLVYTNVLIR